MTRRARLAIALAAVLATAHEARAQFVPAPYPRGYAFKDEPVMSVNRSYFGYTNFVDVSGRTPAFGNPPRPRTVRPYNPIVRPDGSVVVPARRGFHPFRRRR